jgi:hypothetical protein
VDISDITTFVERKRNDCEKLILEAAKNQSLTLESAAGLIKMNDRLARNLAQSFLKGESLVKLHAIKDLTELLTLFDKPTTEAEVFSKMRALIEEDELGAKNPEVRKTAKDIAQHVSELRGITVPIPPVNELYRTRSDIQARDIQLLAAIAEHSAICAEAVYDFVYSKLDYVGEGGENFQRALHTLLVGGGDCDDFAILTASLLRAIGYSIFLQFLPGHVFTGVVLARINPLANRKSDSSDKVIEYVLVPLDRHPFHLMNETFDVFDILFGRVEQILRKGITRLRETRTAKEAQADLQEFLDTELTEVSTEVAEMSQSSRRMFLTDSPIITEHMNGAEEIIEAFADQIKRALALEGVSFRVREARSQPL